MMTVEKDRKGQRAEVLAPVANMDMLNAAIHNGADAVYIGMPGYNARARSEDFDFETLKTMMDEARIHDVRVLIAFNILIFEDELSSILPDLQAILELEPDAIITQDIGLARLIRRFAPQQILHASTQMTTTHALGIECLEDLDFKRFVLGRELSIEEVSILRASTDKELEMFVHGALCVAYSGQCLTSESFGGRSANRGQCAQSCRMPYGLVVDGQVRDLGGAQHLVSPLDLCGVEEVPRLIEAGVQSLKIEGRYKSAEYVASTSAAYRKAVDGIPLSPEHQTALETTFSRGFYKGWLDGVSHQRLVTGFHASHRGSKIGTVELIKKVAGISRLGVAVEVTLQRGDSLLFVSKLGVPLGGSQVFDVEPHHSGVVWVDLSRDFDLGQLKDEKNIDVYLNRSPTMDKVWQRTWKDVAQHKRTSLVLYVLAKAEGYPLRLKASWGEESVQVESDVVLQLAQKRELEASTLKTSLGGWGRSAFEVKEWSMEIGQGLFMPDKVIKQTRQKLQKQLEDQLCARESFLNEASEVQQWMDSKTFEGSNEVEKDSDNTVATLSVLIREPEQLDACEGLNLERVILDYKHGVAYGPSLKKAREMGHKVAVVTTRVLKPGAERRLRDLLKLKPDAVLVRNLAALRFLQSTQNEWNVPWIGDFSLNATNHLTVDYLLSKGLDLLSPSYDLNLEQLKALLPQVDVTKIECTVHQYMPSFHMEHCVFAAFLSSGSSMKDCGMVCREHKVELRDTKGVDHPLQADQECRNTMFNGVAQSVASELPDLMACGVRHFRIEALTEDVVTLREKIKGYLGFLQGQLTGRELKDQLGLKEKFGVTEGQWLNNQDYQDRKKL